jgi:MFS family permease
MGTPSRSTAAGSLLSPGFVAWLAAETLSATGDGIFFFALAWTATSLGAQAAGVVLTVGLMPTVILTVFGGALADQWGLRRTIIWCNVAMCALLFSALAAERASLHLMVLLCLLAAGEGVVSSVQRPANSAFSRLFFADHQLARAMSLTGSVLQVARLTGPAIGGIVVAAVALRGVMWVDIASFAAITVVLTLVRPAYEPASPRPDGVSAVARTVDGVRAARRVPGTLPLLGAIAVVAGGILPMLSLCVPLLIRAHNWGSGVAGIVEASWIAGGLAVSLFVARWGTRSRLAQAMAAGPLVSALGILTISLAADPFVAYAGGVVMGIGTVTFTCHAFPLYVQRTPPGMLARFQALLLTVQFLPTLAGDNALGALAAALGAAPAMWLLAASCVCAALVVLASPVLRQARLDQAGQPVEAHASRPAETVA